MMSSSISEVRKLKRTFLEDISDTKSKNDFEQADKNIQNENFILLNEIQTILENCKNLTNKQKLNYCNSQRYFMKLYLKEINRRI